MAAKVVKPVKPSSPTIDEVCEEFLAEQSVRLKPRTLSTYEAVLDMLRHHLNGYAYETLSQAESALFDRYYNADGKEHREFCQLFGPDKIAENLGMFLGYFMIRKVMAGADFKRAAGTVTKKLSKWLASKGYVSSEHAETGADEGAQAARDLPRAERAARILFDAAEDLAVDPNDLAGEDHMEFDHFTISRLESGKVWLGLPTLRKTRTYGPIPVPSSATKLLEEGWDISCSLGRIRGKWRIVEVANVYPL